MQGWPPRSRIRKKLADCVCVRAHAWQPPHAIEEDCVGGLSVRLQFSQEERWTTAFKYLLQNLKWLLTWHSAG